MTASAEPFSQSAAGLSVLTRLRGALSFFLPQGTPLPGEVWRKRHNGIVVLLWLHVAAVTVVGVVTSYGLAHASAEAVLVAAPAVLANLPRFSRRFRATAASLGLLTASGILIHLSGGYIEAHFHFFIMVGVITLYQDWTAFLAAIAFVALHHGVMGTLDPRSVYNHPDALAYPWRWAAIHAGFISGASAVGIINWRLSETTRARTASILHAAGDGVQGLDARGNVVFVNPAAQQMTGYSEQEMLGRHHHDLLHHSRPDGSPYPWAECPLSAALTQGVSRFSSEEVFWRSDGSSFSVECTATPIREHGAIAGAVLTFRDISERKQAEENARRLMREQAARAAAEAAERRATLLADASSALSDTLDYATAVQRVAQLVVPELADWCVFHMVEDNGQIRPVALAHERAADAARAWEMTRRYPPDPNAQHGPVQVIRTGRTEVYPEITDALLERSACGAEHLAALRREGLTSAMFVPLIARGHTIGALTLCSTRPGRRYGPTDQAMTEEIARRAALCVDNALLYREAETGRRRLLAILEQSPEGIIIVEADGRVADSNPAARTLIPLDDWRLDDWRDVALRRRDGQSWAFDALPFVRALRQGETVLGAEMTLELPGLSPRVLLVNAAPIVDSAGRVSAAIAVFQDITERNTLEQLKDEFLSLAAHELKTPLTTIKGNTQLLLRRHTLGRLSLGSVEVESLEAINDKADFAHRLVNEMLDLSRIQTGRLQLQVEQVDLAALLRVMATQQQAIHPSQILTVEGADQEVAGQWDRVRLEQVLTNLLDNAAKFSSDTSGITVRLSVEADQATLTITDRGIGIPARDLPHIFERHYRAGNVHRGQSGLGLGLYLTRQIIERLGGRIRAESTPGQGSTFHITLPLQVERHVGESGDRASETTLLS